MVTKDIWATLTKTDKRKQVEDTLVDLNTIQEGKHPLSGKHEQGRLSKVKKDLEDFLLSTAEWEGNKQPQKQF